MAGIYLRGSKYQSKNMHKKRGPFLEFTGERLIPDQFKGFTFYYEHLLRYHFSTQFAKKRNALDLGSGVGYGTRMLKGMGAKRAVGIDLSKESIQYAKKKYQSPGIEYVTGDVEKLPDLGGKFGLVVAFELFEHLAHHDLFLKNVKSVLEKKGIFTVSTPNKLTYFNKENPFHINELYPDEFKKVLKKYFKYVYLFNQQCVFAHTMVPFEAKSDLSLNFLEEKYITQKRVSLSPEIGDKSSMYIIAVCSDTPVKNIDVYSLDTFKVDEFSLEKGVEAMSATFRNQNTDPEIRELRRSYEEITSSRFFKLWQRLNRFKKLLKLFR